MDSERITNFFLREKSKMGGHFIDMFPNLKLGKMSKMHRPPLPLQRRGTLAIPLLWRGARQGGVVFPPDNGRLENMFICCALLRLRLRFLNSSRENDRPPPFFQKIDKKLIFLLNYCR
jgi:hypothetical protein